MSENRAHAASAVSLPSTVPHGCWFRPARNLKTSSSWASWVSETSVVPNVAAGVSALLHEASTDRHTQSAMSRPERRRVRGVTNHESNREFAEHRVTDQTGWAPASSPPSSWPRSRRPRSSHRSTSERGPRRTRARASGSASAWPRDTWRRRPVRSDRSTSASSSATGRMRTCSRYVAISSTPSAAAVTRSDATANSVSTSGGSAP